jgi:hypothetical protein
VARGGLALLASLGVHGVTVVAVAMLSRGWGGGAAGGDGFDVGAVAMLEVGQAAAERESMTAVAAREEGAVPVANGALTSVAAAEGGGTGVAGVSGTGAGEVGGPVAVGAGAPNPAGAVEGGGASGAGAGPIVAGGGRTMGEALTARGVGVSFAGLAAERVRSVVYVVDASGPMVTILPRVLGEVQRSVSALSPTQRFGVVVLGDPGEGAPPFRQFEGKLVDANPRNVGRLKDWLGTVSPSGRSNPLDGLRVALSMKPQAVFLLSRSIERSAGNAWGAGREATIAELEKLNPVDAATGKRGVVVKTIQFKEDDPTGTMQAIARLHGGGLGSYRVLRGEELGR